MNNKLKRTRIIVPLIVVLMLISIICTIASGINLNNNTNKQIAEIEPNTEEILADTVTAGNSYTIPADGVYRIELYGGRASRGRGASVIGEMRLSRGNTLRTVREPGGKGVTGFGSEIEEITRGGDRNNSLLWERTLRVCFGGWWKEFRYNNRKLP